MSTFKNAPNLWSEVIPINFHVDYWDYLGWKDPFAMKIFTDRQRRYYHLGHTQNIATPEFVVNGRGWNGWFRRQALSHKVFRTDETLEVTIKDEVAKITVENSDKEVLYAHVAILGFGIETDIKRGENRGRKLIHDFVVIGYKKIKLDHKGSNFEVTTQLPNTVDVEKDKTANVI